MGISLRDVSGELDLANESLMEAIESAKSSGVSPKQLAMVLEPAIYASEAATEAAAFGAWAPALAPALRRLRAVVAEPWWLTRWAVETARVFGADATAAAYGETFFQSWQEVVGSPEVRKLLERRPAAVVMGSALGGGAWCYDAIECL